MNQTPMEAWAHCETGTAWPLSSSCLGWSERCDNSSSCICSSGYNTSFDFNYDGVVTNCLIDPTGVVWTWVGALAVVAACMYRSRGQSMQDVSRSLSVLQVRNAL